MLEHQRVEYEKLFGTPEEQEAEARELAERMRRNEAEARTAELQREANRRAVEERWAAEKEAAARHTEPVTRSYGASVATAQPQSIDVDGWRKFILSVVRKEFVSDKMLGKTVEALGKKIADWDVEVCQATKAAREEALAPLRAEIAELRAEVAELKSAALRRSNKPTNPDEDRKRAGEIRRSEQVLARARAA